MFKSALNKTFQGFAKDFCKAFSCDFDELRVALAKKSQNTSNAPELFDDIRQTSPQIDKKALNELIETLGHNTRYADNPPAKFLDGFEEFVDNKVRYYSFKDSDIAQMQKTLREDYNNPKIRKFFEGVAQKVEQTHKQKRARKLHELNAWAFGYKNDDLIKKLSFRSTYVNILYESIVRQNGITNIVIEDYYRRHRMMVQQKIAELTGGKDAKGKLIVRKYAANKVYKSIGAQDKFKLQSCCNALKNYRNEPFYDDAVNVLKALDGGEKNRNLETPLKTFHFDR